MATAIKVAARRRRGIHVLVTITVPASAPIDAELPEHELGAQTIIEQAKLQGGRRVTGHWEKVRAGRAGRLIVEEAREMGAQAIVMPLPRARRLDGVRQDGRDRAGRAAVPGHHPGRPREGPRAPTTVPHPLRGVASGRAQPTRRPSRRHTGAVRRDGPHRASRCWSRRSRAAVAPLAIGVLLGVLFVAAGRRAPATLATGQAR